MSSRSLKSLNEFPLAYLAVLYGGLAVFFVIGAFMVFQGCRWLLAGNWDALAMIPGGLVVSAMLPAVAWMDRSERRQIKEQALRRVRAPNEPWKWRQDWSRGRITSQSRLWVRFGVAMAVIWNLLILIDMRAVWIELTQQSLAGAKLLAYLFFHFTLMALGVAALVWAYRVVARWKRFGESCFVMDAVPCHPGQALQGTIETSTVLPSACAVSLHLECNFTSYSEGIDNYREVQVLWEDRQTLRRGAIGEKAGGSAVPVRFNIPASCPETTALGVHFEFTDTADEPKTRWWLEMTVEDADYWAQFEIPVFKG